MSAKRAPAAPPELPGFTFVDVLGSGGFADVYLYEQALPKRRVAVKVLLTDRMSSGSVEEFTAEANVMAMLSTHPAIVTIYQAGLAQDGRPYLVMEYCPKPNLQARYRREAFSLAEALRVGVQVSAAVETAHRAGVLHRDIKPANILVTEYNRPALTDFGIASTTTAAAESAGMSIPWSPPESFADVPRSDPRSDVYALGATVYSLLAGRSPFEIIGQRNGASDLIQRIETMPLPSLGRADVPASLQRTLERAMAKSSADRYESAIAFARALQKVQIELSHSVTGIDILDDAIVDDEIEDEDDGMTRVRGVVSIDPETTPAAGMTRPSATTTPGIPSSSMPVFDDSVADQTMLRPGPSVDDTMLRPGPAALDTVRRTPVSMPSALDETIMRTPTAQAEGQDASAPVDEPRTKRSLVGLWIGLAAAVVVIGVIVGVSLPGLLAGEKAGATGTESEAPPASKPQDPLAGIVPSPTDIVGTPVADGVHFTWTNPDPQDGDRYLVGVVTRADADPDMKPVDVAEVTVPADASGTTCLRVIVLRSNSKSSEEATGCTP